MSMFFKALSGFISSKISYSNKDTIYTTDSSINGKDFRSISNNQYFWVMAKHSKVSDLFEINEFVPSSKVVKMFSELDPACYAFVRLEITDNQNYWVETNQDIHVTRPTMTVLDVTIDELLKDVPEFVPFPIDTDVLSNKK